MSRPIFGINKDNRDVAGATITAAKRRTGFGAEDIEFKTFNQLLYEIHRDHVLGTAAQLTANDCTIKWNGSNFVDKNGATVTIQDGDRIEIIGLDDDVDLSADDLVLFSQSGVDLDSNTLTLSGIVSGNLNVINGTVNVTGHSDELKIIHDGTITLTFPSTASGALFNNGDLYFQNKKIKADLILDGDLYVKKSMRDYFAWKHNAPYQRKLSEIINNGGFGGGISGQNLTMSIRSTAVFDTTTVNANSKGFKGGVFDGRYLYLIPNSNGSPFGQVTRIKARCSGNAASLGQIAKTKDFYLHPNRNISIGDIDPSRALTIKRAGTSALLGNASDLLPATNDSQLLQLWNDSDSALFSGILLKTRTTNPSAWQITNEWQSNYVGDLVFRGRSGASASKEALRLTPDGDAKITGSLYLGGTQIIATAAELNKLSGLTATTAELNRIDGLTASAAELNKLDGATVTTTQINRLLGIGSSAVGVNDIATLLNKTIQGDSNTVTEVVSIKDQGGLAANGIKTKVINIGTWNLFGTTEVTIAHGLSWSSILGAIVLVNQDVDGPNPDVLYQLETDGYYYIDGGNIVLHVNTEAGAFFRQDYYNGSQNRGTITIFYKA